MAGVANQYVILAVILWYTISLQLSEMLSLQSPLVFYQVMC